MVQGYTCSKSYGLVYVSFVLIRTRQWANLSCHLGVDLKSLPVQLKLPRNFQAEGR